MTTYDAVVVGSGPNGLAAAIRLAQAQLSVLLIEGKDTIGGGMRSAELTLPGFTHDVCSAIHPLAFASPFFASLPLQQYGLEWIRSPAPLAHPFKDGKIILLEESIGRTARCRRYSGTPLKTYILGEPQSRIYSSALINLTIFSPSHIVVITFAL
jgi:phytoene dehydrogenase-like protein